MKKILLSIVLSCVMAVAGNAAQPGNVAFGYCSSTAGSGGTTSTAVLFNANAAITSS